MARVTSQNAQVWYSPTKRRRYFSRSGAIHAEAKALILIRYPTEKPEQEQGRMTYPGYHFPSDEPDKYKKMLRRLKRIISKNT